MIYTCGILFIRDIEPIFEMIQHDYC